MSVLPSPNLAIHHRRLVSRRVLRHVGGCFQSKQRRGRIGVLLQREPAGDGCPCGRVVMVSTRVLAQNLWDTSSIIAAAMTELNTDINRTSEDTPVKRLPVGGFF